MNTAIMQRNTAGAARVCAPRCAPSAAICRPRVVPRASAHTNGATQRACSDQSQLPAVTPAVQLGLLSLLSAAPALAEEVEEAAAATTGLQGPSPVELFVLLSPIILYGIFNVYRDNVNPRASLSDFFFILAGFAVLANIVSILVFKVRLF